MFAIALATAVGHLLSEDTIYTLKLRRRGIDIAKSRAAGPMRALKVARGHATNSIGAPARMPVSQAVAQFNLKDRDALPVADRAGRYCGVVTARVVEERVEASDTRATVGAPRAPGAGRHRGPDARGGRRAAAASAEDSGLPVLDADRRRIVGWLTHRDLLRLYGTYLAASSYPPTASPRRCRGCPAASRCAHGPGEAAHPRSGFMPVPAQSSSAPHPSLSRECAHACFRGVAGVRGDRAMQVPWVIRERAMKRLSLVAILIGVTFCPCPIPPVPRPSVSSSGRSTHPWW